jgi:hypothetical protein
VSQGLKRQLLDMPTKGNGDEPENEVMGGAEILNFESHLPKPEASGLPPPRGVLTCP